MPFVRNAIREECHFPDIALFRHRPEGDVLDVRVEPGADMAGHG